MDELLAQLSDREREVLDRAVAAVYFADNHDYKPTLWEIIRLLLGVEDNPINITELFHKLNPE